MSVVAGLEGLSHREHEAKTHWHCFHFFGPLSLSPIDFIGVEGLALEGRSGKTLSTQTMTLLWAGEVGQGSLRYGLTFGLPLHVFISCCWGGRVVPQAAWRKISLTLFSLLQLSSLSPIDFIWVRGLVGSSGEVRQGFLSYGLTIPPSFFCVLLLGWKGCPIRIMKQHLFGILFTLLDVFHYFVNWMPQQFMKLIQNGTPK